MAKIIDGKAISKAIKDEVKQQVEEWKQQGITVTLAVIQVGSNQASTVYVNNKKKACEYTGIRSLSYELPEETTQEELLSLVRELNDREDVNGILVQLPLPAHMDEDEVIRTISPKKDVDGFHPQSVGALCIGQPGFVSCTLRGLSSCSKDPALKSQAGNAWLSAAAILWESPWLSFFCVKTAQLPWLILKLRI